MSRFSTENLPRLAKATNHLEEVAPIMKKGATTVVDIVKEINTPKLTKSAENLAEKLNIQGGVVTGDFVDAVAKLTTYYKKIEESL